MHPYAHVLYYDGNQHVFTECPVYGRFESTNPEDFGLPAEYDILLVLHKSQHLGAWLNGEPLSV